MANLDEIEQQAEKKVVEIMDRDLAAARMLAWVVLCLQVVYGVALLTGGGLIGAIICAGTALVLFWLLIQTRAIAAPA